MFLALIGKKNSCHSGSSQKLRKPITPGRTCSQARQRKEERMTSVINYYMTSLRERKKKRKEKKKQKNTQALSDI